MTSLPPKWFRFRDRGVLREGAYADVVVFDPDRGKDAGARCGRVCCGGSRSPLGS
jgi:N-acyl-D-aspartate/D-glutamate deacylase